MTYDNIRVTPLATFVGAEISGIDLATSPGEVQVAEARRAFGDYGVVFFRDQQLTPEQHIAFAQCFGEIDVNRFFAAVPAYPMIAEVRKEPEQRRNIGKAGTPTILMTRRRHWARCSMRARCRGRRRHIVRQHVCGL